jgi:cyclopropane fatty-acyl-phospholipid synthase-like methyltransferase
MVILNIAAGKFQPLLMSTQENLMFPKYILNVDTSYFTETKASHVESDIESWNNDGDRLTKHVNLNMDVFEFMERTSITFDRVVIYRFLEHVSFTQVEYFIYLVSTVLHKGGQVDVIVPNYIQLAEMILNDNPNVADFAQKNILLTTELLNEPSCPHASIWTPERMKHFWELENRFKVGLQHPAFKFDGRDIYLRSFIERI